MTWDNFSHEIDEDVWVKYIMKLTDSNNNCIIDDLRFQNELNYLSDWTIISLTTSKETRLERIKKLYPENYKDRILSVNMFDENIYSIPNPKEYNINN